MKNINNLLLAVVILLLLRLNFCSLPTTDRPTTNYVKDSFVVAYDTFTTTINKTVNLPQKTPDTVFISEMWNRGSDTIIIRHKPDSTHNLAVFVTSDTIKIDSLKDSYIYSRFIHNGIIFDKQISYKLNSPNTVKTVLISETKEVENKKPFIFSTVGLSLEQNNVGANVGVGVQFYKNGVLYQFGTDNSHRVSYIRRW